jgi:outer membrane protein
MGSLLLVSDVFAGRSKIALVEMRRIWRESNDMKSSLKQLKTETGKKQEEIASRQKEIATLREDYEKKSVILSDSEKAKKSQEIDDKIKALQEFVIQTNKDLQKLDANLRGKIIEDVHKVIRSYGKKKSYKMILNKAEGIILYSDGSADITDDILKSINKADGA